MEKDFGNDNDYICDYEFKNKILTENVIKCDCKGIRYCEICKSDKFSIINKKIENDQNLKIIEITPTKTQIKENLTLFEYKDENFDNNFNGFYVVENVLNETELNRIINEINETNWINSQSGRKKQDFGVKINYKKKKIKSDFNEIIFPNYKEIIENKTNDYILSIKEYFKNDKYCEKIKSQDMHVGNLNYFTIHEIGNLRYCKELGSHIEPHIDDAWIWGDRIVGFNIFGEAQLTFLIFKDSLFDSFIENSLEDRKEIKKRIKLEINIPLKSNMMYIMSGSSRYNWFHEVKPHSIKSERVVITCREFTENIKNELKLL